MMHLACRTQQVTKMIYNRVSHFFWCLLKGFFFELSGIQELEFELTLLFKMLQHYGFLF